VGDLMSQDPIFTEDEIETARVFFAQPVSFIMGAVRMDAMPPADLPEVAFAGRSNVGKSSLINGLVNQKYLARASNEPGRTREINFFLLAEKVRLVDLPGYGFARVSRSIADKFQDLGRAYLLIDARHGLKTVDLEALDALDEAAVSYQIVLTKADKIKPAEVDKVVADTLKAIAKRPAAFPRVLATSSEKGLGLPELRAEIVRVCIDE
jgi:GTP-binding protein